MINYKIIENKLRKIIENNLIEKDDKILIAFSGGPDSVFLYYILKYLQSDFNLEISLLYVNHNLREDVEKDLNFVKNFSKKNEVSLYIGSVDVKEYSKINKKSIELSARELRYEKLSEFCNKIKVIGIGDYLLWAVAYRMVSGFQNDRCFIAHGLMASVHQV